MQAKQAEIPRGRTTRLQRAVCAAAFALPWLLVALATWSDRPYWLDLSSHFLLHAAVVCMAIGGLAAIARWRLLGLNLVIVGLAVMLSWRLSVSAPREEAIDSMEMTLRIIEYNARQEHSRHDNDAIAWIRDQDPDLIVLIEPPWGLLSDYPFLRKEYPYSIEPEAGLMWEVIVLSRHPAEVTPIVEYREEYKFSFAARRSMIVRPLGGRPFLLSAMHPPSPRTLESWRRGVETTGLNGRILSDWRRRTGMEVVVAGDFNSTPAGRNHRLFARESGLKCWSPMFGAGTWPAHFSPWFSLPIDRVWTSPGVRVSAVKVGPRFRSDHRPVVADLVIERLAAEGAPQQVPASSADRQPEPPSDR